MSQAERREQAGQFRVLIIPGDLFDQDASKLGFFARPIFRIDKAYTLNQALETSRQNPPHLIIFSNEIEDTSTDVFCRRIHTEFGQQTRLLMLTDMLTDSTDSADSEADAHLVIPVEDQQLFATVAGLLNLKLQGSPRAAVDFITQMELFPRCGTEDLRFIANVLALTECGMRVESPLQLPLGAMGRLRFYLPDADESLVLYGMVKVLADELSLHYELEFIGNSSRDRRVLGQFIMNAIRGDEAV